MEGFSKKEYLSLKMPTEEIPASVHRRIELALNTLGYAPVTFPLKALRKLYPLCRNAGFDITVTLVHREYDWVVTDVEAGDTTMIHFLLGLDAWTVFASPYAPVTMDPGFLWGEELGMLFEGLVYMIPAASNYVGGDIVSGLMKLEIHKENETKMFFDIGTNGEPPKPQAWRLKDTTIPKISLDLGSHLHNMILFLTGKNPLRIMADQTTFGLFPQIIDNVYALAQYPDNMKAQIWFSKTALGSRNGLKLRLYGSKGSAEWLQLDPETLKLSDVYGNVNLMDRTTNVQVANQARYNRFKAGHPAGFIEAFANYYKDIADSLSQYLSTGKFNSTYVFDIDASCAGLSMMQAAAKSAKSGCWEDC